MKYYTKERAGRLRARVAALTADWPGVTRRAMFGCPCFLADGTMFAVVADAGLVLTRLGAEVRQALAARHGATQFQAGARTIRKWACVPVADAAALAELEPWVRWSYEGAVG